MAKTISHEQWMCHLKDLYFKQTGRTGYENEPGFERWLEKVPVEEIEKLLEKLEK